MKTTVDRIKPTRAKITFEVTPEEFKPALDKAYAEIASQVNIPGFRKGKVPAPILDQRVGRGAIIGQAINDSLDDYYRQALDETGLSPLGQPSADVKKSPDEKTLEGNLEVEVEVEVRPEITLKDYKGLELEVDEAKVTKKDVDAELEALQARFGSLVTVDRPAKTGDFTSIDLKATIDGELIDEAEGISYEIGSGNLLDGIDEALLTLTAGESTTFKSTLVGGEHAGKEAEVNVTLQSVKERELPKADDDFAQLASEFDTLEELRKDLESKALEGMAQKQRVQAREKALEKLIASTDVPVSEEVIEREVHNHLEGEGRLEDDKHRAEVTEESEKSFKSQMLLDEVAKAEEIRPEDQELINYLVESAGQYGMQPNDFIQTISQNGQIGMFASELSRRKALDFLVDNAKVVDTKGKAVKFAKPEEADS